MRAAVSILVLMATACGNGEPRAVQVQLINRGSCSPPNYDLSCMRSLVVRMFDDGQEYRSNCTTVGFATWQDLVSSRDTDFLLEGVRARPGIRIEVRGYHGIGGYDPCESLTEDRLVMWGTSEAVNTTSASLTTINVPVDCRQRCDCRFMQDDNEASCVPALERGICAPLVRRKCRDRTCADTSECFDGLLQCVSNICEPAESGVCDVCESSSDCNSGMCIHHVFNQGEYDVDEKFCADTVMCPPPSDGYAHACPEGMQCTKLGDGFFELLPL